MTLTLKKPKTQEEANRILNDFSSRLDDLISECLVGKVTKEQINEYYGFGNDCQITEFFKEAELQVEIIKEEENAIH